MSDYQKYADAFGIPAFYDHQVAAFDAIQAAANKRACLYYPTGKGKTKTALTMMALLGQTEVLVMAPPSTHQDWVAQGRLIGIEVNAISHAKFRQKAYNVKSADTAIIVDEFHMLGGRKAEGWRKFDRRIAPHLRAPFIICSATPSYNDAERVYCVDHVLDPIRAAGGYDQYQLEHCLLEVAYRGLPNVVGFKAFKDAAGFLESLPEVYYMDDTAQFTIVDDLHSVAMPNAWKTHNFDQRTGMMMHSLMTRRVSWANHHYLDDSGRLLPGVVDWLQRHIPQTEPCLIYCDKTSIAEPTADYLSQGWGCVELLTGKTSKKRKEQVINDFRAGKVQVLVATATLATGTDGLDKVTDTLLLLQDTQDDSLRRQIVGRILARGDSTKTNTNIRRLLLPPVPKK